MAAYNAIDAEHDLWICMNGYLFRFFLQSENNIEVHQYVCSYNEDNDEVSQRKFIGVDAGVLDINNYTCGEVIDISVAWDDIEDVWNTFGLTWPARHDVETTIPAPTSTVYYMEI